MSHRAFEARYPGRCTSCSERIEPGDTVTYDGDDEIVHGECDREPQREDDPTEACGKCWTVHSGECL